MLLNGHLRLLNRPLTLYRPMKSERLSNLLIRMQASMIDEKRTSSMGSCAADRAQKGWTEAGGGGGGASSGSQNLLHAVNQAKNPSLNARLEASHDPVRTLCRCATEAPSLSQRNAASTTSRGSSR